MELFQLKKKRGIGLYGQILYVQSQDFQETSMCAKGPWCAQSANTIEMANEV